jgi:hypothetical protein
MRHCVPLEVKSFCYSDYLCDTKVASLVVIVVIVDYTNRKSDMSELKYTYRASAIAGTEIKFLEPSILPNNNVLLNNRHGVRVVFVLGGTIGSFNFMALLRNLVAALGLLKVSSLITDQLMLRVLPQRDLYEDYKYQKTEDFSDIRERKNDVKSEQDTESDSSEASHRKEPV